MAEEMVIPLPRFLTRLHGSEDHVYAKALTAQHGMEKHTPTEWAVLLETMKRQPVSYDRLRSRV